MPDEPTPPAQAVSEQSLGGGREGTDQGGISLDQLSEAFAEMLQAGGEPAAPMDGGDAPALGAADYHGPMGDTADPDRNHINPRDLLEAMLFVGHPDGEPLTKEQVTAILRGVLPSEVDELVGELNAIYAHDGSPYEIIGRGAGYQLVLRPAYQSIRDRFYGRVRQAGPSPAGP